MRFGIALPHYDYSFPEGPEPVRLQRVLDTARRAEELGFSSAWISDHFFLSLAKYGAGDTVHGALEPFLALSAIATQTTDLRLGTLVVGAGFRHPSMIAQQAASLDRISAGRFELGLGAGWYEEEFGPFGLPFGTVGERFDVLERTTEIVSALRGGTPVESVQPALDGATVLAPVRERWPIWIGAKGGPRAMRLVARCADGWNASWRWTPETYRDRLEVLTRACEEAGRDPATVRRSVGLYCLVGSDEADLAGRFRNLQAWTPGGALDTTALQEFAADTLTGTPAQLAEQVAAWDALGVEEIVLNLASMPFAMSSDEQLDLAAAVVLQAG